MNIFWVPNGRWLAPERRMIEQVQGGTEPATDGRRKKGPADLTDTMTNAGFLGLRSTPGRDPNG